MALILAYSVFATSLWAVAAPGDRLRTWHAAKWVDWNGSPISPVMKRPATSTFGKEGGSSLKRAVFTNFDQLRAIANAALPPMQSGGGNTTINFFGPTEYVRTTGPPNSYTTTVQVPSWVVNPFNLHIQNGEADGSNRVSSATISINNVQIVAAPSDFNQNVFTIDRSVTLTPTTTLYVTLASKPGSYLRINLAGANADHTPPVLTIAAPLTSSAINTPQAHIDIRYQDLPGSGEPAASGVDTTTLQVLLDGTDRTSLFTKFSNEATADLPASLALAQGPHTLTASIKDLAGNTAQAASQFQVDTTPPTLQILQPVAGIYLNNASPLIQIAYSDNLAVNTASLKVIVNGADQSAQFAKTASGATATIALPQGANSVTASISDTAGNRATASTSFNIDTTPPTVTILHPLAASVHGAASVEFSVQFSDDQAVDMSTAQVSVDGALVPFTTASASVSGTVTLPDANHTLAASVKDKAGNSGSSSVSFRVDTTAPDIHIVQPASGAVLNNPTPSVQIQIGSSLDLDSSTFHVTIDGTDETTFFPLNGLTASGTSPHLADGSHTISAQVAKVTGKVGQAQIGLLIDTVPPQITIDPIGFTKNPTPTAVVRYSDSGSGVNLSTLHVLMDGADVTSTFSVGASSAQGVLAAGTGLPEGPHSIQATITDNAGNVSSTASTNFTVDLTPPVATFTSPANNSFINTAQPTITLTYSDSGSGVDTSSIHIFLQLANQPETDITSLFTISAGQATAVISPSGALTAGTYHLRAQVSDRAGNQAAPASVFAIDLTPPTYNIVSPAANAFLNTATPNFVVTYQDDSSGVDPARFVLQVDGVGRTADLTVTATGASGTLVAADALADGTHTVNVKVFDRAGNEAPENPQPFLVDTIPPTLIIATPVIGGYTNVPLTPISISYSDSGSGVDVTTFKVLIDGVDQTAQFTVTATGATGLPAAVLPDGLHTILASIKDLAGNPTTATASYTVDTTPPQITITQPANGLFTNAASLVVTGSVVDASPVTVTVEGAAVPVQNGAFTSAGITLGTNATQLIHVVATDAAGNSSTAVLTINIDRTPPTITGAINPAPNAAGWNNTNVTVTFTCSDSDSGVATCPSPVSVTTEGANQAVSGTAVDKAGNVAQATVTVNIDKTPPVITGTPAPAPNAAGWNTTDVTITYTCSDSLSGVLQCPPARTISTEGKAQTITATVSDIAGNTATSTVLLNIEKTAPAITASFAPPANAAGWNNSNVTVSFVCTPSASDIVSCQTPISVTTEGKGQVVSGAVTDQAGKSNTATATVNIDKTPPVVSSSTAPPPNAAGWNNTNVVISYLCSDSLSGISICPSPVTVSTEGAAQQFTAQATDQAGNTSAVSTTLNIDKTPPTVTAAAAPPANGAGWNNSNVTVTFTCTDSVSGVAICPPQQLVASEGQNQNISGQATDVAGNVATGSITLSIDKTPPTIVQLSTPDHISRLHGGQISAIVNDNFFVSQVVISVNGTSLGTFTSAPYQAALQVPTGANPGDTLTVTAVATDEAGNTQSASRAVRVAADGVIVGQVLSDVTSFPIQGAVVQTISTTAASDQTDDHGRYSLQASDSHLFLSATSASPATTTVEREVFVQSGVGTVPVDARLTPLSTPVTVGSAGGTVTAGNVTITVFPGTVGDGTTFQLTPLSSQGLPGLLPLGWTPFAAFDLRASSQVTNLSTAISNIPNTVMHLVTYNTALHAWTMVTPGIAAQLGETGVFLPSAGTYALVFPDPVTPPITIPDAGAPLPGIPMQLLDPAASSSGSLSPATLPPSGGTSIATLGVQSASPVPSGTVIQANISEKFSLKSGDVVSQETRSEDIVLYGAIPPPNANLGAQFAVTPSQKYTNAQLLTGKVHLDIMAGREGVRGQPGGSDPVTLTDGIATLSVPGGALSQDTAINVQGIALEDFVPSNGSIGALQEVLVDFSGETLNTPGQLSIAATALNPTDTFLLTQVQRIDGVPHMVLVALAQINGANLTSVASPGLPGITQGGEYVFYDVSAPMGFVQGVVSSSAGPVQALVLTDSLPIVSITGADGKYIVPAIAGTANLKASSPHTNLAGSASVQVTAGQTTQANISLAGTVTGAVVSPADGTLGVPVSTTITITTSAALNPQSISQANLVLLQGTASSGTPVAIQPFVLSGSGTVLSFAPVSNLNPATQYTIQVAGLADTFGGAVVVPVSSFTTKAATALNFDPNAIIFSFPDANGNIQVTAPAGSLPAGTQILMVDQSSGLVLTLTALNDGSVSGNFPGTINDILQVTVTAPNGATNSFIRNQFVAADGTTAVGSGGGTVTGPGNTGLIIPQGALTKATTFKLTPLDQTAFPQLPSWPSLNFASGLHVDAPEMPTFNQEVKLAFPVPPNAPPNAFYYVYRRLKDQNGKTYFETIDHAFVQGTGANAQVVTASPPFCGYHNPIGNFNIAVAASSGSFPGGSIFTPVTTPFQDFILMFDIAQIDPNQPGIASPGLIVGLVQQTVPAVLGQSAQTTQPYIDNVQISLDSHPEQVATYDPKCSTFTIFDPQLGGGTRTITATARATLPDGSTQNTTVLHATVDEVNGVQVDDATFAIFAGLEHQYRNIGRVTLTFPPTTPPPPPPQLSIRLFTLDPNTGHRIPATGILQTGTNVVVAFQSQLTVQGISIAGTQLPVSAPDSAPEVTDNQPEKFLLSARANGLFLLGNAGTYTITATAVDPASQTHVTANQSFLVVGPGGGNNTTLVCNASPDPNAPTAGCMLPKVVDTAPLNGDTNISPSVFPQITFNEPVTNVPANLIFADHTGTQVPAQLIGIRPFDPNNPNANLVANPVQAGDVVTALTIQPLYGLKYNETYTLSLNAKAPNGCLDNKNNPAPVSTGSTLIIDQNKPPTGPFCLEPLPKPGDPPFKFTTFGPQEVGSTTDQFSSTRPIIIGQRAFMGRRLGVSLGALASVDISDPTNPIDKGTTASFLGLPIDAAGQAQSPVTGGPLMALAAAQPGIEQILPSNVWIYDVTNPDSPVRVAAVSATTSSTQDGEVLRIFMKDQFLYTSTFLKGLQVIDLSAAVNEYQSVFSTSPTQFGQAITTEGNGFATDTVVNTIPLYAGNYQNTPPVQPYTVTMRDVKAADYVTPPPSGSPAGTPGITQTLMVATGRLPLVIADPQQIGTSGVIYPPPDGGTVPNGLPGAGLPTLDPSPLSIQVQNPDNSTSTYTLTTGGAVALGTLSTTDSQGNSNSEQIAVLIGAGAAPPLPDGTAAASPLFVVNMVATGNPSHPVTPVVQGVVGLPAVGTDVALHGNLALVATGLNKILLVNLVDPTHPVLAGEIDAPPGGIFGDRIAVNDDGLIATSSFNSTIGGLHVASLGPVISITTQPPVIFVDKTGLVMKDFTIKYQALDPEKELTTGTATVISEDQTAYQVAITDFSPGEHTITVPAGTKLKVPPQNLVVTLQKPDGTFTDPVSMIITGDFDTQVTALQTGSSSTSGTPSGNPLPFASSVLTLVPDVIPVNSPDTVIQVSGQGLTGLTVIFVRQQGGVWTPEALTVTSDSQGIFTLPAALASAVGAIEVSLSRSDASAAALFVGDPSLPAPSGVNLLSATIDSAVATAIGAPNLVVTGNNFTPDMQIAVGAQDAPAFALPVISRTTTSITADSSAVPIGLLSNLTVYGVSGDKTLITAAQPVGFFDERAIEVGSPADSPDDADFFSTKNPLTSVNPADIVPLGDVALVSVAGDMHALDDSGPADTFDLTLTGVNLTSGMMVQVASPRGDDTPVFAQVPLQNVTQVPDSTFLSPDFTPDPTQSTGGTGSTGSTTAPPNTVNTGKATVPSNVKKTPSTQASVKAKTKTGQTVAATKKINVEKFFTSVPMGGRVQLVLYKDKDGNLSIHVPQIDRQSPTDAQPVPGEQVQLTLPGTDPLLRVTQESESVQGNPGPAGSKLLYLRGQHLTLNPPDPKGFASVRTINPNDPSSALRPWAQVIMSIGGQASTDCSNTKTTACRNFDVGFESLGPLLQNIDRMIEDATDQVTPESSAVVPPQFLKSQFMQETSLGATNFRYEALTFDFATLSGDLRSLPYETDLFHSYETAGNVVQKQSQNTEQFGPTQSISGQPLKFQLSHTQVRLNALQPFHISDPYEPCVRLNGNTPSTRECGVRVNVQEVYQANQKPVPGKRSVEFAPVRSDTIWRHSTRTRGNIAGVTPQGGQYSIDQNSGIITLGRQLQTLTEPNPDPTDTKNPTVPTFELMTVSYGTFNSTPRTCAGQPCQDGTMVAKVLDLNQGLANGKVRPSGPKLNYTLRQSLCTFYNSNMPKIMPVLAMTTSEDNLEFLPPGGPTGQYQVRDQRYCGAISQPYPASTYGIGQMSLQLWSSNSAFAKWFDATATPITDLLDNNLASAELTVQAHLLKERGGNKCDAASTSGAFQQCWSDAFVQYNNNGAGYANDPNVATGGLAPIVWRGGQCFEPKQSYGNTFATNLYCTKKNFTIHKAK